MIRTVLPFRYHALKINATDYLKSQANSIGVAAAYAAVPAPKLR